MIGWARWLAVGLALILFAGSVLLFLQPAEGKRAHDFASVSLISGFGLMSWAGLWKRQER
jgi:hypothetical protein